MLILSFSAGKYVHKILVKRESREKEVDGDPTDATMMQDTLFKSLSVAYLECLIGTASAGRLCLGRILCKPGSECPWQDGHVVHRVSTDSQNS